MRAKEPAVSRKRKAFTIIELLIVVGVIAILAAIVLLGMRSITGRSKEQQTKLMLQNLRNMLAEFEVSTRFNKQPALWGWNNGSGRITVTSTNLVLGLPVNLWRAPHIVGSGGTGEEFPGGGAGPDPLDAPGNVSSRTGGVVDPQNLVRNGSRQIQFTQLAMNFLMSVPANRKALEGISSDRYFTPYWVAGDLAAPGPDRVLMTTDESIEQVWYYPGSRAMFEVPNTKNVRYLRCTGAEHMATGTVPGAAFEIEGLETTGPKSLPAPLLLDAWNNPILFVPASGLRVRKLNGEGKLDPTKQGQTFVVVSPEGLVTPPNLTSNTKGRLVRAGKPFFVSAGPDGDFSTGDDNLYSFEE